MYEHILRDQQGAALKMMSARDTKKSPGQDAVNADDHCHVAVYVNLFLRSRSREVWLTRRSQTYLRRRP